MSFCFGLRPPKAVSALRDFNARGRQSRPCAKVFTCGENACTAHSRRRPEGRVGAVLSACREFENIQIVVTSQKRSTCYAGASFLDTWGPLNCSGEVNSPCAEVLPAAKRSNAAKAARPRRAVGQDLRQLIQNFKYLDCSDLPKKKHLFSRCFFFGFRRPAGSSTLRH